MIKYRGVILPLVGFKLLIHLFGNINYGFHRDELLHLAAGQHPAWGYMEFPPLIGWIGALSGFVFDDSLFGTRLFPTLAGVALMLITLQMVIDLSGKTRALILAGICVIAFLPYFRNHTLFQPVAFAQLWWTVGAFLLVRYHKTDDSRYLVWIGAVVGLGLLTKYTMAIWAIAALVGLLIVKRGELLRERNFYIGLLIVLLLVLPNVLWQSQNGWPALGHLTELKESQLNASNPFDYLLAHIQFPGLFLLAILGGIAVWRVPELHVTRSAVITVTLTFLLIWIAGGKGYYSYGVYPVVFATGAIVIANWFDRHPKRVHIVSAFLLMPALPIIPHLTPVLPIELYVEYAQIEPENGRYELTSDYADMFGWEEQVALVDSVYRALPDSDRSNVMIWAENYGEAGALAVLGQRDGLPRPISRHGSFWVWGYGNANASVWISIGNEASAVNHVFQDVRLVRMITHPYAIGEENDIPLFVCRNPKIDIPTWWADYRPHIFD